jgi:hypothetical protein
MPKVALPEKFTGKRHSLRTFLNQLELVFAVQPSIYYNDSIKVATLGTLLSGPAAEWFNHYLENVDDYADVMNNWAAFKTLMKDNYAEHDSATIAANRLTKLRQDNSSASQYASSFRHFSADLKWNEEALIHHFKMGLNDNILDLLLNYDTPNTLTGMINLAIRLDNRLYEHRQEQGTVRRPTHRQSDAPRQSLTRPTDSRPQYSAPRNPPSSSRPVSHWNSSAPRQAPVVHVPESQAVPMDLDAMNRSTITPAAPSSDEERQYRRDHNLCFYCGGSNHTKFNCPLLADRKGKGRRQ